MSTLSESNFNPELTYHYIIKPLNVLKQVITMFMSSDKIGIFRDDRDLVRFVLNPDEQDLPYKYKVFCYYTNSKKKRFLGYHHIGDFNVDMTIYKWAEISFKPFGYLLAIESLPAYKDMMDITFFKSFKYQENARVRLEMPFLETNSGLIGDYRSIIQIMFGVPYGFMERRP